MSTAAKQVDTRDAILDSVERLFARYGYKKMTIDDIAAETGIGKGTVYLHFKSKEDVALSHIDRIIERLKLNLHAIAAKKIAPETRIKQMLVERVMVRFASVQGYMAGLNDLLASIRPGLLARRKNYFEEEAQIIAAVLKEGRLGGPNALETARTLVLATNSLLPYSLSAQELGEAKDIDAKVKRLADVLIHGII
jgi:AcrR family transcriptional regulator